jgi:uncharacterized protein (DUF302 family)
LLLPCNAIVYEDGDGSVVKIIDPMMMLDTLSDNETLYGVAEEAKAKLERVVKSLTA